MGMEIEFENYGVDIKMQQRKRYLQIILKKRNQN